MFRKAFVITLALFLVMPSIVFAANGDDWWGAIDRPVGEGGKRALSILFGTNIPEEWTDNLYSVLQWIIFPFISLWVILFGILSEVNIFRSKPHLNYWLALLIALTAGPTGLLIGSVRRLFVAYGFMSFWGFAAILIIGTVLWIASFWYKWGLGGREGWKGAAKKWGKREQVLKSLDEIEITIARTSAGSEAREVAVRRQLELRRKLEDLEDI